MKQAHELEPNQCPIHLVDLDEEGCCPCCQAEPQGDGEED
jgi:hypothetical protein